MSLQCPWHRWSYREKKIETRNRNWGGNGLKFSDNTESGTSKEIMHIKSNTGKTTRLSKQILQITILAVILNVKQNASVPDL